MSSAILSPSNKHGVRVNNCTKKVCYDLIIEISMKFDPTIGQKVADDDEFSLAEAVAGWPLILNHVLRHYKSSKDFLYAIDKYSDEMITNSEAPAKEYFRKIFRIIRCLVENPESALFSGQPSVDEVSM